MALQREQIVQTAEKFVSRGKIEPAIKEYRKLLTENPNDITTLNRVGDLYARIQRNDEAIDFFTQIAEQYAAEGFFVKAIAIYKKIIKLDPTRLEVYEQLAELYHRQGLVTEARTQYQVLADYYQKHANAPSAIAIYQKMVLLEPENPTYHVKLAEIYHQQQLVEKAMGEYRIIAELMIKHGRPQEAAQVYERALDIDSQNLPFITDAVLKLRQAGNAGGAAHFLSVAVERNPQAERVARMVRDEPTAVVEAAWEPEVEAEPEVSPPAPRSVAPPRPAAPRPIEIEADEEIGLSFDDDLSRAMAEAAAAVGDDERAAAEVAEPGLESGEIELNLDDMFEIELPDEEGEPTSLVKPPADLMEAPRRPAWAQDATGDETVLITRPEPQEVLPQLPTSADTAEAAEIELEITPLEELEDLDAKNLFAVESSASALPAFMEPDLEPGVEFETEPQTGTWGPADLVEEPAAPAVPAAAARVDEEPLDRPVSELHRREPEREEDLVNEAEVLAKYGLEDKAIERLEDALRLRPNHLGAYALLIQICLDKGRHGRVLDLANRMSAAAGGRDPWPKVSQRLLRAGYTLEGGRVTAGPGGAEAAPAHAPAAAAKAPARAAKKADRVDEMLQGLLGPKKKPAGAPRPAVSSAPPPEVSPPVQPPPAPAPLAAAAPAPAPPAAKSGPPPGAIFNPLQIGELVESLDVDDGSPYLPSSDSAADLFLDSPPALFASPIALPPMVLPPLRATGVNRAALDDTGTSWLDQPAPAPEPSSAAELFDDEDDFFDLAGELVEELSKEEVFQRDGMLVQSEQTLEEIVEGFKKGVAEHLSPTDYDTHFNLGIAYREMGLLDEAIGEFQLASKDQRYLVLCCSMLGLCFLDKGLPELAIKWYRRALDLPSLGEEDSLGMMYDLGNAYMSMGDDANAYKTFVDLYGINTNYRDVVAKLEELGRPR